MAAITTDDRVYSGLPNELVSAANDVDYAYRETGGEGGVPLILLRTSAATWTAGILRW